MVKLLFVNAAAEPSKAPVRDSMRTPKRWEYQLPWVQCAAQQHLGGRGWMDERRRQRNSHFVSSVRIDRLRRLRTCNIYTCNGTGLSRRWALPALIFVKMMMMIMLVQPVKWNWACNYQSVLNVFLYSSFSSVLSSVFGAVEAESVLMLNLRDNNCTKFNNIHYKIVIRWRGRGRLD